MHTNASPALKEYWNNDPLVTSHRVMARERIANATMADGTLDWRKLPKLLSTNPKLLKNDKGETYLSAGIMFAASSVSGHNFCSHASLGCGVACLQFAGHGQRHMMQEDVHKVLLARITRSILYIEYRVQFMAQLHKEIRAHIRKANKLVAVPVLRPNTLSDILWEKRHPELFTLYPDLVLYDYTAVPNRKLPENYHVTFSRKENNEQVALDSGLNVAVVFDIKKGQPLPKIWKGRPVLDGDVDDKRFEDKRDKPRIVGLRIKGGISRDDSGFAVAVS